MLVVSWNVNSIKARLPRLLDFLQRQQPDVLCLQELKVDDAHFPAQALRDAGYDSVCHGQRTYNGVAILARTAITDARHDFADDPNAGSQARLISACVQGVRIVSIYVPNGQEVGSDKYAYKLAWLKRLHAQLQTHYRADEPLLLCGDFNIAPQTRDVCDPAVWENSVLCHHEARAAFAQLLEWGLQDTLRQHHTEAGIYSWWDYRMLAFPKNQGLRIDLILGTAPVLARSTDAGVFREERKGKLPSDHAPVWVRLRD